MPPILIVDGVTGAGKTSVLAELRRRLPATVEFIPEDDTLGDLTHQIRDPLWLAQPSFSALESVLHRLERGVSGKAGCRFLVERFHLTAFALHPDWNCYRGFDERLGRLGTAIVLLTYPMELAEARSIQRVENEASEVEMDGWYGSRALALEAVVNSQGLRWEGLQKTSLPFLHIDTREKAWSRYAGAIHAYWNSEIL